MITFTRLKYLSFTHSSRLRESFWGPWHPMGAVSTSNASEISASRFIHFLRDRASGDDNTRGGRVNAVSPLERIRSIVP